MTDKQENTGHQWNQDQHRDRVLAHAELLMKTAKADRRTRSKKKDSPMLYVVEDNLSEAYELLQLFLIHDENGDADSSKIDDSLPRVLWLMESAMEKLEKHFTIQSKTR